MAIRDALVNSMQGWLPSRRPPWAMMPRRNARLLQEVLLSCVSVLDCAGVRYTAHQGTLLGAARIGGLLPWDIDGDLGILDESADTFRLKVEEPLRRHGLLAEFNEAEYYFTVRPFVEVGGLSVPLFPIVEIMMLTATQATATTEPWFDRHRPKRMFLPGELLPLQRFPWHTTFMIGPGRADPVLRRLYGDKGDAHLFTKHAPAAWTCEAEAFWGQARPFAGDANYAAIEKRAVAQQGRLGALFLATPWYAANGMYNAFTESARRAVGGM